MATGEEQDTITTFADDDTNWQESWRKQETERLRIQASKELEEARTKLEIKLREENKSTIAAAMAEFKKDMTPPTAEEIQKSLDDEYLEFNMPLRMTGGIVEFTLGELSSEHERKLVRLIKEKLTPHVRAISGILLELAGGDWEENLVAFVDTFEPALEVLHEIVAYILSHSKATDKRPHPEGQEPKGPYLTITAERVRQDISLNRQLHVLQAQIEANRLRDFLFGVSRLAARTR